MSSIRNKVSLHIDFDDFMNLELIKRGLYRVRVDVSTSSATKATPVSCAAHPSRLYSIAGNILCLDSEASEKSFIDDVINSYYTRTVYFRYLDEHFDLCESVSFLLDISPTESEIRIMLELQRAECIIEDLEPSNSPSAESQPLGVQHGPILHESDGSWERVIRRTSEFVAISTRTIVLPLPHIPILSRAFHPVIFDSMNLASIGVYTTLCLVGLEFHPPVRPEISDEVIQILLNPTKVAEAPPPSNALNVSGGGSGRDASSSSSSLPSNFHQQAAKFFSYVRNSVSRTVAEVPPHFKANSTTSSSTSSQPASDATAPSESSADQPILKVDSSSIVLGRSLPPPQESQLPPGARAFLSALSAYASFALSPLEEVSPPYRLLRQSLRARVRANVAALLCRLADCGLRRAAIVEELEEYNREKYRNVLVKDGVLVKSRSSINFALMRLGITPSHHHHHERPSFTSQTITEASGDGEDDSGASEAAAERTSSPSVPVSSATEGTPLTPAQVDQHRRLIYEINEEIEQILLELRQYREDSTIFSPASTPMANSKNDDEQRNSTNLNGDAQIGTRAIENHNTFGNNSSSNYENESEKESESGFVSAAPSSLHMSGSGFFLPADLRAEIHTPSTFMAHLHRGLQSSQNVENSPISLGMPLHPATPSESVGLDIDRTSNNESDEGAWAEVAGSSMENEGFESSRGSRTSFALDTSPQLPRRRGALLSSSLSHISETQTQSEPSASPPLPLQVTKQEKDGQAPTSDGNNAKNKSRPPLTEFGEYALQKSDWNELQAMEIDAAAFIALLSRLCWPLVNSLLVFDMISMPDLMKKRATYIYDDFGSGPGSPASITSLGYVRAVDNVNNCKNLKAYLGTIQPGPQRPLQALSRATSMDSALDPVVEVGASRSSSRSRSSSSSSISTTPPDDRDRGNPNAHLHTHSKDSFHSHSNVSAAGGGSSEWQYDLTSLRTRRACAPLAERVFRVVAARLASLCYFDKDGHPQAGGTPWRELQLGLSELENAIFTVFSSHPALLRFSGIDAYIRRGGDEVHSPGHFNNNDDDNLGNEWGSEVPLPFNLISFIFSSASGLPALLFPVYARLFRARLHLGGLSAASVDSATAYERSSLQDTLFAAYEKFSRVSMKINAPGSPHRLSGGIDALLVKRHASWAASSNNYSAMYSNSEYVRNNSILLQGLSSPTPSPVSSATTPTNSPTAHTCLPQEYFFSFSFLRALAFSRAVSSVRQSVQTVGVSPFSLFTGEGWAVPTAELRSFLQHQGGQGRDEEMHFFQLPRSTTSAFSLMARPKPSLSPDEMQEPQPAELDSSAGSGSATEHGESGSHSAPQTKRNLVIASFVRMNYDAKEDSHHSAPGPHTSPSDSQLSAAVAGVARSRSASRTSSASRTDSAELSGPSEPRTSGLNGLDGLTNSAFSEKLRVKIYHATKDDGGKENSRWPSELTLFDRSFNVDPEAAPPVPPPVLAAALNLTNSNLGDSGFHSVSEGCACTQAHVVVFPYGFGGHPSDLRVLRATLRRAHQNSAMPLVAYSAPALVSTLSADGDIVNACTRLACDLAAFVRSLETDGRFGACTRCRRVRRRLPAGTQALGRLSFVCFSLGGVVARLALRSPLLQPVLSRLHAFVCLGTPHCGLALAGSLIRTGLGLWRTVRKRGPLDQMALADSVSTAPGSTRHATEPVVVGEGLWESIVRPPPSVKASEQDSLSHSDSHSMSTEQTGSLVPVPLPVSFVGVGGSTVHAPLFYLAANGWAEEEAEALFGGSELKRLVNSEKSGDKSSSAIARFARIRSSSDGPIDTDLVMEDFQEIEKNNNLPPLRRLLLRGFSHFPDGMYLNMFQHIVLVGSQSDTYSPFHSALCVVPSASFQPENIEKSGRTNWEIIRGFHSGIDPKKLRKIELSPLDEEQGFSIDKLIGRAGHIHLLESEHVAALISFGLYDLWV